MKKRSALLALILAGLMSFSVFGTAACKKKPSGTNDGDGTQQGDTNKPDGDDDDNKKDDDNKDDDDKKDDDNKGDDDKKDDDNKGGDGDDTPETVLTTDTAISLVAGEKHTLTASDGVVWKSENTNIATVTSDGVVSAVAKGVAKITATKVGEKLTCTVIVLAASESSSSGTAKQPFSFNESVNIGSIDKVESGPAVSDPNAAEYAVTFSDGAVTQNVANGGLVVEPLVEYDGHYLMGWHKDSVNGAEYDFSQSVTAPLNLVAKWGDNQGLGLVQGNYESIALEWSGSVGEVKYKLSSESEWKPVDSELVRENGGSVRADILGLKAGKYDVQANGKTIKEIPVKAYDRSGYAHFKYTNGVGAYKDDGTLKDNALVIYVTNDNKNNVLEYVYRNGQKEDISKLLNATADSLGVTKGTQTGIGEILNNRRYSGNDRLGVGIAKLCEEYGAVAVRFIGTVKNTTNYVKGSETYGKTEINGLTWYAKSGDETPYNPDLKYAKGVAVPNGGTVNDNGSMARITNAHDVTIEGVGDDAVIQGWGFHFISSGNGLNSQAGSSFEVRNITFNEYPEDAIGFEGEAESKKITSPVKRCWVHNNTFLPGHCPSPAESDKGEGDGSCDFKRGYYFTASYNYFEYCHKTNLIGSADDSLQYNLTYHHNIWYQCGSRVPLIRRANVHFYNNYVFGDPSQKSTPYAHISKPSLSYVHSLRASCYLFSENNYYEGCKNILRGSEGGDGKFYGNTYYACSDTKTPFTEVDSRTQTVSNNCNDPTPGTGNSYATFDTDPNLFYYDASNKKTDVSLLDDSLSARLRTIFYAGAQGHGEITKKMQEMNNSKAVTKPGVTTAFKAKGQAYVFSVDARAVLTIDAIGEDPQVIRNDGKVYLAPFSGQRTVLLDAGTYMVCSGKKDKEITINSLSVEVDNEEAQAKRVAEAKRLIGNIPDDIKITSGTIIEQAQAAYENLITEAEREALGDVAERLLKAQVAYETVLIKYAMARIEYIGTVTIDSKADIEAASQAYSALKASAQAQVTNYSKLLEANEAFAEFEIASIKFGIDRLPDVSSLELLVDSKVAVELALELYNSAYESYGELDKDNRDGIDVSNLEASLKLLNEALDAIELAEQQAQNLADFNALLGEMDVDDVDMTKAGQLKALYGALTTEQVATLTAEQKTKYEAIVAAYNEYLSQAVSVTFIDGKPSNDVIKSVGTKQSKKSTSLVVHAYGETALDSGLKFEDGTVFELTLTTKMTVSFYLLNNNSLSVNDNALEVTQVNGDNVATVTLEAGTYTIKRAKSEASLYYMTLVPAK